MAKLDTLDIIVLVVLLVGTIAYFTKGTYWGKKPDPYANAYMNGNAAKSGKSRDILKKMEESEKNCVVFYGSQTGTAEDYASRLAKEGHQRFGLKTMTADLEDYDYDNLNKFPEDHVAMFVMATYGEGEPTDNAVEFMEFVSSDETQWSDEQTNEDSPLKSMTYVTFGLGNNTYEHYNEIVRKLDRQLKALGATRVSEAGEGDDGAGTMEEDFLAWKEPMWEALAKQFSLEERENSYEAVYDVKERDDLSPDDDTVYLGEPNKHHLEGDAKGPYGPANPYIAPIAESKELFHVKDRNCLHMEIDISGSNLSYQTGDHIAVWPANPGATVDKLLKVLGLTDRRHKVITVKGLDATAKVPFPTPTTYDAALRYHMEIGGPVSRQFVDTLSAFAPDEESKAEMKKLGSDKEYFQKQVSSKYMSISQVLETVKPNTAWSSIPFSLVIEGFNKMQPRYYSISSSAQVQPKKVSITAIVESIKVPGVDHIVKGITTNYLLALKEKHHGASNPDPHGLSYDIQGPRNKYDGIHVPVHIRHSNFKLPSNPSKPIIMIGPGTGVAPFRGFVQERADLAAKGESVGKSLLFFGCRKKSEDFIYEESWKVSPKLDYCNGIMLTECAGMGRQAWQQLRNDHCVLTRTGKEGLRPEQAPRESRRSVQAHHRGQGKLLRLWRRRTNGPRSQRGPSRHHFFEARSDKAEGRGRRQKHEEQSAIPRGCLVVAVDRPFDDLYMN